MPGSPEKPRDLSEIGDVLGASNTPKSSLTELTGRFFPRKIYFFGGNGSDERDRSDEPGAFRGKSWWNRGKEIVAEFKRERESSFISRDDEEYVDLVGRVDERKFRNRGRIQQVKNKINGKWGDWEFFKELID